MWFPVVHKPQVVRSLTWRLSKARPSAYRSYRLNDVSCFPFLCMCCLCTMCTVLYDIDRLHGSTLPYYPCCRCVTFLQLDVLCLVDSHR
jgi:hypothetical protein